jgi:hypothetical protein
MVDTAFVGRVLGTGIGLGSLHGLHVYFSHELFHFPRILGSLITLLGLRLGGPALLATMGDPPCTDRPVITCLPGDGPLQLLLEEVSNNNNNNKA